MPRIHMTILALAACPFISILTGTDVNAQVTPAPPNPGILMDLDFESGPVRANGIEGESLLLQVVHVDGAHWLRLVLERVDIGSCQLRIRSLLDDAVQVHDAESIRQWSNTSAYFNGDIVLVELLSGDVIEECRFSIRGAWTELGGGSVASTICGDIDDRLPSTDPRAGRLMPATCTAWIIDDLNHCMLSAGHCIPPGASVIQFNVPESTENGSLQHPGPEDQYAVDFESMQFSNQGVGDDWAYFGCFQNTETGLTAAEAQGDFFQISTMEPGVTEPIRITGYGSDSSPWQWNHVQQTHLGPLASMNSTSMQYQTDTTGGNSGSPVIDETSGMAVGIHTHGGCNAGGGANSGTRIAAMPLQDALAAPQGICDHPSIISYEYPFGLPGLVSPAGTTSIEVDILPVNDLILDMDSPMLHVSIDSNPFIAIKMTHSGDSRFIGQFPATPCPSSIEFFITASTTTGEIAADPSMAPRVTNAVIAADDFDQAFNDDFETANGWSVSDDPSLTTGSWEQGIPAGFGDRGEPPYAFSGDSCMLTGNIDGDWDIDGGCTYLVSPGFDATGADPHVSFWLWYSNTFGSAPLEDSMQVEISPDGGRSWILVDTIGPDGEVVNGGWYYYEYRISDHAEPTGDMRARFTACDLDQPSIVEAALDQFIVRNTKSGVSCSNSADINSDGSVDGADLAILLAGWKSSGPGDLNQDGVVDGLDIALLLAAWTD